MNQKKMKPHLPGSQKCMGCMACMNQCKKSAINMKRDSWGCFYADINRDKCIGCRMCEKVCPVLCSSGRANEKKPVVFAAISRCENERLYSTSGGIFPLLAEEINQSGGYVAGAVYDKNLMVKHILTKTERGIYRMRQSKYVQSCSGYIYRKVEKKLKEGKCVLFSGTPCQIEALYLYLDKKVDIENLITCEVICIGVPAPGAYNRYLKIIERKFHSSVKTVWFKNKEIGWDQLLTKIEFCNGKVYKGEKDRDLYLKAFRKSGFILRKACYSCHLKKIERSADLSLGDFWNLKNTGFNDNKGISLVLLNTDKGKEFFKKIEPEILREKRFISEAAKNEGLLQNTPYTWKTVLYRILYHIIPFTLLIKITNLLK